MSEIRRWARPLRKALRLILPRWHLAYAAEPYTASFQNSIVDAKDRDLVFEAFLSRSRGKRCLQVSVKEAYGAKFGENWISVDKYDHRSFIDRYDDIEDLDFPDNSFDAAVCWSVLEHVPHPETAVSELTRVLRPGGEVFVQLPYLYPYHGPPSYPDYWRVGPDGLRLWMSEFDEIACGCYFFSDTKLAVSTFFCGRKRL